MQKKGAEKTLIFLNPRFLAPHLSHAKLPDIKTRTKSKYEELNPKELQRKIITGRFHYHHFKLTF